MSFYSIPAALPAPTAQDIQLLPQLPDWAPDAKLALSASTANELYTDITITWGKSVKTFRFHIAGIHENMKLIPLGEIPPTEPEGSLVRTVGGRLDEYASRATGSSRDDYGSQGWVERGPMYGNAASYGVIGGSAMQREWSDQGAGDYFTTSIPDRTVGGGRYPGHPSEPRYAGPEESETTEEIVKERQRGDNYGKEMEKGRREGEKKDKDRKEKDKSGSKQSSKTGGKKGRR